MASAERHGRARYRRGCRCDQCKCAENEYQRTRRQRIAESVGAFGEPAVPSLVLLRHQLLAALCQGKCAIGSSAYPANTVGAVVAAVMAEIEAMGTNRRPGLAAAGQALARIMDNPRAVSTQPAAARQLVAILAMLSRGSQRRGKLASVKSMTTISPAQKPGE
jgi:hypothetical protein